MRKKIVCPKCGSPCEMSGSLSSEVLCKSCRLEKSALFSAAVFSLEVCNCGAVNNKGWKMQSLEDVIKSRIVTHGKLSKLSIVQKRVGNRISAEITAVGKPSGLSAVKKETKRVFVTLRTIMCETCSRLSGGYYEAVVQLRGGAASVVDSISKKGVVSVTPVKGGVDIRYIKKAEARKAARPFEKAFLLTKSFKLVKEKKGKKLYRNFYSLKS